jgi:thioredoxin 1
VPTVTLTADSFGPTVADCDIVLVDFWAQWCGPCRMFGPIYERVSDGHPDIVFGKVDTETEPALAGEFGVMSIPTLAILRDNVVLYLQPGVVPEEGLEQLISQVKDLDMDEVHRQIAAERATA